MSFALILIIGLACMAATLALAGSWERRRARLLKEAGTALGLRAFEKGEHVVVPSVEIMRKRGRTIGAALEGVWQGESITVFDLSYPAGKNVSRSTVFVLRLARPCLPEFAAIRKNIWLYTPTVDLPNVQEPPPSLKTRWFLYAPGGQWPSGANANTTQWMERGSEWSFEGHGSALFLYRRAKRAASKALQPWLDESVTEAKELLRRITADLADSTVDDAESWEARKRVFRIRTLWRPFNRFLKT